MRTNANVLIVEDDLLLGEELADTLKRNNYHVTDISPNGQGALEKIAMKRPDLVLMDIGLSGKMDGIETTKRIREKYTIPTIYLTSYQDKAILDEQRKHSLAPTLSSLCGA